MAVAPNVTVKSLDFASYISMFLPSWNAAVFNLGTLNQLPEFFILFSKIFCLQEKKFMKWAHCHCLLDVEIDLDIE